MKNDIPKNIKRLLSAASKPLDQEIGLKMELESVRKDYNKAEHRILSTIHEIYNISVAYLSDIDEINFAYELLINNILFLFNNCVGFVCTTMSHFSKINKLTSAQNEEINKLIYDFSIFNDSLKKYGRKPK